MNSVLLIWNNIWNCLMGISAPISAIGMIAITYYVYKWNSKDHKKDIYFRYMVNLYYKIEDEENKLIELNKTITNFSSAEVQNKIEQCFRQIAVNCTIMQYYLLRIPVFSDERRDLYEVLFDISRHPGNMDNYNKLSVIFNHFCEGIRDKKYKTHTFSIDNLQNEVF